MIAIEAPEKNDSPSPGSPVANMWCTHTPKPRIMVATVDSGHHRIADQRAATKDRQAIGNHAHGGQHDGIHPRMAEDPEQVLP